MRTDPVVVVLLIIFVAAVGVLLATAISGANEDAAYHNSAVYKHFVAECHAKNGNINIHDQCILEINK